MTPKQEKALERHIVALAPHLGLDDWTFHIHPGDAADGKSASVSCVYGRNIAHISLCADWWSMPAAERQHVIVHELLHVAFDRATTYLYETLPDLLGKPAWHGVENAYRQSMEHSVDRLAMTLARHLPVCEEVK